MENDFFKLTPALIMQAVEASGFSLSGHCLVLNSYENRVYDLKLADDTHIVTKFYRPGRWSQTQIEEEHQFLLELQANEIPVCAPLAFADGKTVHETNGIYFAIWPRSGGHAADELSEVELQILGRLLARIHNTGAQKAVQSRITLSGENYGLKPLTFLLEHDWLPASCRKRYTEAVHEIVTIYDTLGKEVPFHRIHGDCHLGNLLHGSQGWFFLDFDDFLSGPAVQDVWMIMPARDKQGLQQREVFLDAYRQFRDFDNTWLRLIEPLRALRFIRYAAWLARRWDDPVFPKAFPYFGTPDYWEKETTDLEEQLNFFHDQTASLPENIRRKAEPAEAEAELTNKDFFWDLED